MIFFSCLGKKTPRFVVKCKISGKTVMLNSKISQQSKISTESELMAACRRGEAIAFRKVMAQHQYQVRATVLSMLGDTTEAEDMAQETFIHFFESIQDFREEAKIGTYLTRIAINLSLNEIKRRKRKSRWLTFIKKEAVAVTAEQEQWDTKQWVHQALQLLEPAFRAVVVLRILDGYSVKETAQILQLPQGTVASRLARGQQKLKTILEKIL